MGNAETPTAPPPQPGGGSWGPSIGSCEVLRERTPGLLEVRMQLRNGIQTRLFAATGNCIPETCQNGLHSRRGSVLLYDCTTLCKLDMPRTFWYLCYPLSSETHTVRDSFATRIWCGRSCCSFQSIIHYLYYTFAVVNSCLYRTNPFQSSHSSYGLSDTGPKTSRTPQDLDRPAEHTSDHESTGPFPGCIGLQPLHNWLSNSRMEFPRHRRRLLTPRAT